MYRTASCLRAGPRVFCDQTLHRNFVQGQLGVHPFKIGVLGLELLNRRSSEASKPPYLLFHW